MPDIEELENLDTSEIHAQRLHAKEIITPKNGENLMSRSQMEESNCLEEIRASEHPP